MTFERRLGASALALFVGLAPSRARAADSPPTEPSTSPAESRLVSGPAEARADASARVLALSEEGSALYDSGEYQRALEKFITAYAIGQDPNLLFNMGRCYQHLGDNAVAEEKYRAFIADPGADPVGVGRARALLALLNEPAASSRPQHLAPAFVGSPRTLPPTSAPVTAPPRDESMLPRVLPWVSLGAGVAFLAAGTTLYALGVHDHAEVTGSRGFDDPDGVSPLTEARARDLVSAGDTKKTLGGIGFGVGGALLATSVVLLVSGDTLFGTATGASALSVESTRHGGAINVLGRF